MHLYNIITGDWSGDGHNITEKYMVKCSHTKSLINTAYNKAIKVCGLKLARVCEEYQDNTITKDDLNKLKSLGINLDQVSNIENEDGSLCVDGNDLAIIYMEMAKSQCPELEYEFVELETLVRGLGYGCYHS